MEYLKVKLLDERAKAPQCANQGSDLGYDLFALEEVYLFAYQQVMVRTGVAVEFPVGFGGMIEDRSSMASKKVFKSAGVIDQGYRGEIKVLLRYQPDIDWILHEEEFVYTSSIIGSNAYHIKAGDKIAQLVPVPVLTGARLEIVDNLSETERGEGGFGSTGK